MTGCECTSCPWPVWPSRSYRSSLVPPAPTLPAKEGPPALADPHRSVAPRPQATSPSLASEPALQVAQPFSKTAANRRSANQALADRPRACVQDREGAKGFLENILNFLDLSLKHQDNTNLYAQHKPSRASILKHPFLLVFWPQDFSIFRPLI